MNVCLLGCLPIETGLSDEFHFSGGRHVPAVSSDRVKRDDNALDDDIGPGGVVLPANTANGNSPTDGLISNNQTNDGSTLNSGVTGSTTTASTGAVNAGDGQTSQVLNSAQDNLGNQASTINDSTACNLAAGAVSSGPIN